MSKHTNEPWSLLPDGLTIVDSNNQEIATVCCRHKRLDDTGETRANANRIVSCVNALEGVPKDALDGGWSAEGISEYAKSLERNQNELVDCLLSILVMAQAAGDEPEKESNNPYKAFLYEAGRLVRRCGTEDQVRSLADNQ